MDSHIQYPERFALITTDEKYLRKPSKQIDVRNPQDIVNVKIMLDALKELLIIKDDWKISSGGLIGYGLAACQLKSVADSKVVAPRAGIIRIPNYGKQALELDMLNPQILKMAHPFRYKAEGCLSFPGEYMTTKRFRSVMLGFVDANTMEPRELALYGFEAVVAQHELDHHDGFLFKDRHQKPTERVGEKIKPNDPCICGSGKKFKKCACGAYDG